MRIMMNANDIVLDKNDTLLSRIDNVDDLIKKRKSIQVTLSGKVTAMQIVDYEELKSMPS